MTLNNIMPMKDKEKIREIIKEYIQTIENKNFEKEEDTELDLSGLNHTELIEILNEFGYNEDKKKNTSVGLEYYIYMKNNVYKDIIIHGCCMNPTLKIYVEQEKEKDLLLEIERIKNEPHHCKLCGDYIEQDNLSVCDKCASEYKFQKKQRE